MVENVNLSIFLFILLSVLTITSLICFNFDFLQPSCIFNITMTVSMFLEILNIQKWNLFIGTDTVIIVTCGMICFNLGSYYVRDILLNYVFKEKSNSAIVVYKIRYWAVILLTGVMVFFAYCSIKEMYDASVSLGNQMGPSNMIKTVRYALENGFFKFSRAMRYRNLFAISVSTICAFLLINNIIAKGKVNRKELIIFTPTLFLFIPFLVLSTGRRSFVHFIIMLCVFSAILYQRKKNNEAIYRFKLLKFLGITGVLSIASYFILGHLTGKVASVGRSHYTIISHYGGLSIPALEQYLSQVRVENQYIGQNILKGIYGNLNSLGFHLEPGKDFLPFVQFYGEEYIDTNVYSAFYRQIADLSVLGMLLSMIICGIIITALYEILKRKNKPILLSMYAQCGYIPFFLFIDDQFMGVIATSTIYCTLMMWMFFKFFTIKENHERT